MRIGVLSDTHVPIASPKLSDKLISCLNGCEMIIHAGDIVEMSVLESLGKICPVKAVLGNMDGSELKNVLPRKLLLEIEGVKIGVIHGWGAPEDLENKVMEAFHPHPDVIVFGHSHKPVNKQVKDMLLFNPGSAADSLLGRSCTYGIIELRNGEVLSEIKEC